MQDKSEIQKVKVLAVDDEDDARKLIVAILGENYDLKVANSTAQALERVSDFKPDIVVTDLKMPGDDGMTLLASVKTLNPEILVVIMTGYADKATAIEAIKKGAFDFLEKPFSPDELRAAIGRAAEQIQLRGNLQIAEMKAFDNARLAALGEMAAGVAHEINNPVTIIQGYARVLKKMVKNNCVEPQKIGEIAEIIDKTSVRISKIITSLRKLARPDTRDFTPTAIKEVIEDTLGLCGERFKNSGVELHVPDLSQNLVLNCNQLQLSQVLLNLLNNAFHEVSGKENAWIRIEVEDLPDEVQISIVDSGSGIPEAVRDKIFQVFFTTKEVGTGTGLGLSLSRQMVENHKGTLTIDEGHQNTCFVMSLPKGQAA